MYKAVEASTLSDMDTISRFDGAGGDRTGLKTIDVESGPSTRDATILYGDIDGNTDLAIHFDSLLSRRERDFVL